MARVKLRCIMGCPGLKSSYQEKGILSIIFVLRKICSKTEKWKKNVFSLILEKNYQKIGDFPLFMNNM